MTLIERLQAITAEIAHAEDLIETLAADNQRLHAENARLRHHLNPVASHADEPAPDPCLPEPAA
jgi:hypothetical protein